MAYNYSERIGQHYQGSGDLKQYGLKESFNERLIASFKAKDKLRRWRFGVLFANSALLVLGIGLSVVAFYLRGYWREFHPFLESYTDTPFVVLQSMIGVLCACALFSCIPLWLNNFALIIVYGLCIFSIMQLQVVILVYSFFNTAGVAADKVGVSFRNGLINYANDAQVYTAVDYVQQNLLCCGADDMEDWFDTETNALPHSCCWTRPSSGEHNCLKFDMLFVQTDSCLPKLQEIPSTGVTIIYAVTICIIIIEAIAFLLTGRLAKLVYDTKNNQNKTISTNTDRY